jgi:hypothetical protein
MKSYNHYGLKFAAVLLFAALACVPRGRPQRSSAFDGKFSLSESVNWQGRLLPAGEYSLSISSTGLSGRLVLHGPKTTVVILASGRSDGARIHNNHLTIESRGRTRFVRELVLNNPSVAFRYRVPSLLKDESAQQTSTTELVAIKSAAK